MEKNRSMMSRCSSSSESIMREDDDEEEEEEGPLPGFRFHPTDEELVSFYLKRKVEKRRPLSIEIIKQIDIYKHDPWDLAKGSSSIGDKEWYFYCKRGRKYRNSIRPNRVTGTGFWKATGIDRPIYSNEGEGHRCIGLKKSLVYYRGSAGKGTKTDWMMHEFRLPSECDLLQPHQPKSSNPKDTALQAEIWTLCRIFKRNKRHTPDWRELSSRKNAISSSSKTSSIDSTNNINQECFVSFAEPSNIGDYSNNNHNNNNNIYVANINNDVNDNNNINNNVNIGNYTSINDNNRGDQTNVHFQADHHQQQWNSMLALNNTSCTAPRPITKMLSHDMNDLQNFAYYGHNWDDLNSVVEFAAKKPFS